MKKFLKISINELVELTGELTGELTVELIMYFENKKILISFIYSEK